MLAGRGGAPSQHLECSITTGMLILRVPGIRGLSVSLAWSNFWHAKTIVRYNGDMNFVQVIPPKSSAFVLAELPRAMCELTLTCRTMQRLQQKKTHPTVTKS